MGWHCSYNFSGKETFEHNYDDCSIRISCNNVHRKTHDHYNIIIIHKLVLAAAHWPGLCWQFQKGFPEPLETLRLAVLTSMQLVYFQCVRCLWVRAWMCYVAVFCIFLSKAKWSTAYGYYSAGAGHSVSLKQFSPSSCIQELMRKETYLSAKTYVYTCNMCMWFISKNCIFFIAKEIVSFNKKLYSPAKW